MSVDARFVFSILTYVVSFDILPMDVFYYELGIFTQTEPYSNSFSFLYYDSINFIVLLGSVALFYAGFVLYFFLTICC